LSSILQENPVLPLIRNYFYKIPGRTDFYEILPEKMPAGRLD